MDDLTRQHEYAELFPYPPTIPPFSMVAENPWPVRWHNRLAMLWEDRRPVDPTDPWSEVK